MIKILLISIGFLFSAKLITAEEIPKVITWENLVPSTRPLEDPFKDLTEEQFYDLESIVYFRELEAQQGSIDPQDSEDLLKFEANLKSANLDINALLLTHKKYLKEIERRSWLVVNELNGRLVRLAGYILPLEFNEAGVNEFLLVPYIGACIHVPPPPPNQIVYIRTDNKIIMDDMYSPVWLTGRIVIEATNKKLTLVDGSDNIPIGYTIKNALIQDYEE